YLLIILSLGSAAVMSSEVPDWGGLEVFKYKIDLTKVDPGVFSFLDDEYLKKNKEVIVLTFMSSGYVEQHGFSGESIIGVMPVSAERLDWESFTQNSAFRVLVQSLAARADEPGLQDFIDRDNPEMVAAIDRRTVDVMGEVPSEDIIGVYIVVSKKIVNFEPNEHYKFITDSGIAKLTLGIVEELKKIYGSEAGFNKGKHDDK
ncbi:hypothetical protein, partial [Aliikangiella maris]